MNISNHDFSQTAVFHCEYILDGLVFRNTYSCLYLCIALSAHEGLIKASIPLQYNIVANKLHIQSMELIGNINNCGKNCCWHCCGFICLVHCTSVLACHQDLSLLIFLWWNSAAYNKHNTITGTYLCIMANCFKCQVTSVQH